MLADVLTLLSALAPLALLIALGVLAQISRRFGEVMRRPPVYRGLYVAMALLVLPLGVRLLAAGFSDNRQAALGDSSAGALVHDGALLVSVLVALAITTWYWGWLVMAPNEPQSISRRPHVGNTKEDRPS